MFIVDQHAYMYMSSPLNFHVHVRIERQKQFQEERVREFDAALQRIAVSSN